ncbi:aminotransferase class V-fold PLP-dependent enzyme [Nonomuraea guangzhouensis]|uniref:Aminotransferase class V-fold PLP-dependent enzyme n=1 Tax=Nonomuraea guangzhouensis TaxID=1291555 RepID=A0ABW4G3G8_9ACTN|nr:aminotransferase class V-fold PLP-dependent enzyme [Nonomuraea guangzhouensis]
MPLDVDRARKETPGCADVVHLNNADAALAPTPVTDAVIDHLRLEARIGGDRILASRAEYAGNVIAFLQVAARTGAQVEVVDDDEHGQLSVADLRDGPADVRDPGRRPPIRELGDQLRGQDRPRRRGRLRPGMGNRSDRGTRHRRGPAGTATPPRTAGSDRPGPRTALCGIVTFTVDGVPATDVRSRLSAAGINTSVSGVTSARFDLAPRGLPGVVRASVHYYNTDAEIERLCAALRSIGSGRNR